MYKMPFTKTYCFFLIIWKIVLDLFCIWCVFLPLVSTRLLMSTTSSRYCINQKYSVKLFLSIFITIYMFIDYCIHVTCTNMTLSTHDQNLTIICSFFSNFVHVFNFIYKFPFFAKNVFFSILAVEGPLSLLSALECKILEINFYYCPNHDFF